MRQAQGTDADGKEFLVALFCLGLADAAAASPTAGAAVRSVQENIKNAGVGCLGERRSALALVWSRSDSFALSAQRSNGLLRQNFESPAKAKIKTTHLGGFVSAKDYLNGAELGEKLPKSNVPVLLDKLEFILLFFLKFVYAIF